MICYVVCLVLRGLYDVLRRLNGVLRGLHVRARHGVLCGLHGVLRSLSKVVVLCASTSYRFYSDKNYFTFWNIFFTRMLRRLLVTVRESVPNTNIKTIFLTVKYSDYNS
jgi:hypothetical protein